MDVRVEVQYRIVIAGKHVAATRDELIALRDQLTAVISGEVSPAVAVIAGGVSEFRVWSADDDVKLRGLMGRGKPFPTIATELDRTEGACRQRWQKIRDA